MNTAFMAKQIQSMHVYHCNCTRVVGSKYKLDFSADAVVKTQVSSRMAYVTLEIRLNGSVLSNIQAVG